jgi:general secretion pathway protein I
MTRLRRDAGFTLIETVVALAILGLGLAVLFRVFGDALDRDFQSATKAQAASLAQSLEARLGLDLPIASGSSSGTFDNGYRWQLDISPYGDAQDRAAWPMSPYQILITVSWPFGAGYRSITLTTLELAPKDGRT